MNLEDSLSLSQFYKKKTSIIYFMKLFLSIFLLVFFSLLSIHQAKAQHAMTERGYAKMIPVTNNPKLIALHKTAPIGTSIYVKNTATGVTIQVKVISQLPDIGKNEGIIIKLSEGAFKALNPNGDTSKKFGVELTYTVY